MDLPARRVPKATRVTADCQGRPALQALLGRRGQSDHRASAALQARAVSVACKAILVLPVHRANADLPVHKECRVKLARLVLQALVAFLVLPVRSVLLVLPVWSVQSDHAGSLDLRDRQVHAVPRAPCHSAG